MACFVSVLFSFQETRGTSGKCVCHGLVKRYHIPLYLHDDSSIPLHLGSSNNFWLSAQLTSRFINPLVNWPYLPGTRYKGCISEQDGQDFCSYEASSEKGLERWGRGSHMRAAWLNGVGRGGLQLAVTPFPSKTFCSLCLCTSQINSIKS